MGGWARIEGGWAANLDASDAASSFSLPRIELHPTPRGWSFACLLANGRRSERLLPGGPAPTARRVAVEHARAVFGDDWRAALDALADG
jgi:hypothetical protein